MKALAPTLDDAMRTLVSELLEEKLPAAIAEALDTVQPAGERLLNRQELAQRLGVSLGTIDTLRAEGLPTVWVIESPRFEFATVVAWLKSRPSKQGRAA